MQVLIKIVIALILPISAIGQINFLRHYSDSGIDFGYGVTQVEDSSYLICGSSSSFHNGPSQAFLMKVDSLGNYKWSQNYGGFEYESAQRVMHCPNEGFFLAGYTNSSGAGGYDFYLVKTDLSGNLEWERTYGTSGWDRVIDATLTSDTGVIMVGETNSGIATGRDMYIVRTNYDGDTLWTKTIGDVGPDVATSIETYQDSLFLIAGNHYVQDSLKSKAFYIYIHEDGTVLDQKHMANVAGHWEVNDITILNDTIHGVGAYQDTSGASWEYAFFALALDQSTISGTSQYHGTNTGDYYGRHITSYSNSAKRYVTMEHGNHGGAFLHGVDIIVSRFTYYLGYEAEVGPVAIEYNDLSGQAIATSDGGAAVVGSREGIGIGGGAVFLMKIGPNEVYPTMIGVTGFDQLVSIEEVADYGADFKLYPNPTEYSVTIELPDTDEVQLIISDMYGKVIMNEDVIGVQEVNVSHLAKGMYSVRIVKDNVLQSAQKLMIH